MYKRQTLDWNKKAPGPKLPAEVIQLTVQKYAEALRRLTAVSYTHLRAHETVLDLVCRLLLENKKKHITHYT